MFLFALSSVLFPVFSACNCSEEKTCEPSSGMLVITSPCPESKVKALHLVKGTVSDPDVKEVWVVIHPMESADYWIQQRATVQDHKWEVICHFGEPEQHVGKRYEFIAVAMPEGVPMASGIFKDPNWPKAKYSSQLIGKITRC